MLIGTLRNENQELALALNQRDEEIRQLRELQEKQKKGVSKEVSRLKRTVKEREGTMMKLKGELTVQKTQNEEYRAKIEDLLRQRNNLNQSVVQYNGRPSTSHQGAGDDQKVKELNSVI
jgi:predicted RNase H-like nuclease (RuvC/YqgF family)